MLFIEKMATVFAAIGHNIWVEFSLKIMILVVFISLLFFGCQGNPVPEEAVKACIESGGIPVYKSNGTHTGFTCGKDA